VILDQLAAGLVIERDEALVEALLGREHRLDAPQHVQVAELRDVASHHGDADRERRREQQADRTHSQVQKTPPDDGIGLNPALLP